MASWAARIPAIKGPLHLSAGTLGLALLGPAVGAIVTMPATGAVLAHLAPRQLPGVADDGAGQRAVTSLAVAVIGLGAASRFHSRPLPHQAARRRPSARSQRLVLS